MKMTMNDRHHDVRKFAIEVINYWFENMDILSKENKKYQKDLVLFLLNGASDEHDEVRDRAIQVLEQQGSYLKEALVKLGEDEQDTPNND